MSQVWKNCTCLPTCHQIEFTYNEQLNKLDPEVVCHEKNNLDVAGITHVESLIAKNLMENGYNSMNYKY